jgi:Ca-activated chloride channel family protein
MLNLTITPQREALLKGFDNEFHALLQVNTDESAQPKDRNNTLNLAIVIDRSGSMAGRPLDEAKRSAIMMVNQMHSDDRIAIITYHSETELVVPSTLCEDKEEIIHRINGITEGGATALHAGWLMGAEEVAKNKTEKSLNRVLLLSDGNANQGLTNVSEIKSQCAQLADAGVTTSTYGLGHNFNELLMIEMAGSGLGQGYYGETADDLADPFREEFELLLNTVASSLILEAEAPSIVNFQLMNNFRRTDQGWSMPDIASGGEGWALFKLTINKDDIGDKPIEVFRCLVTYKDKDGVTNKTEPVKLILEPLSPNAFAAIMENEKVISRASELLVASYQREAREAAQAGDWIRVDQIIAQAKIVAKDDQWMQTLIASLEKYSRRRQREQFSKEAIYSSEKMNKRLVAEDESRIMYSIDREIGKAAYLRRKTERGKRLY